MTDTVRDDLGSYSTDVLTPSQRSYCMSRIRGRDTKPEVMLRKELWRLGLRYRIHHGLPGRPDIVFPSRRVVIFIDGCFWHRCPLHWQAPKSNAVFWERKIAGNQLRDERVTRELEAVGWRVIRVWEHQVKDGAHATAEHIQQQLAQSALGTRSKTEVGKTIPDT